MIDYTLRECPFCGNPAEIVEGKPYEWFPTKPVNVIRCSNEWCRLHNIDTFADSIRTMNYEELAKYFSYIADCDNCPNELDRECCVHEDVCINKWLKWLKQEVEK